MGLLLAIAVCPHLATALKAVHNMWCYTLDKPRDRAHICPPSTKGRLSEKLPAFREGAAGFRVQTATNFPIQLRRSLPGREAIAADPGRQPE